MKKPGTRCDKAWYKVCQGLVQGGTKSGTRCDMGPGPSGSVKKITRFLSSHKMGISYRM